MFDVIWTDPNRELVGEHRAKKDRKKEQKQPSRDRSERNSLSTRSSLSSADSPFSFLRSKGLRQARAFKGSNSTESVAPYDGNAPANRSLKSLPQALDIRTNARTSALSTASTSNTQDSTRPSQDQSMSGRGASTGEMSPSLTCYDSIFSRSPESDSRTSNSIMERASDELSKHTSLTRTRNPVSLTSMQAETLSSEKRNSGLESPVAAAPKSQLTPPPTPEESGTQFVRQIHSSDGPVPPPKNPLRSSQRYSMLASTNNLEAWRSPDGWSNAVAGDLEKKAIEPTQKPPPAVEATKVELLNFAELQDEVARMATTSPQEILERLRHLWSTNPNPAKDMKVHTETHRWMLSAIHHLDSPLRVSNPQDTLVVCENHDTVAYLAALRPNQRIYHVSDDPVSRGTSPIIHPIPVPFLSAAMLPRYTEKFDEAYSLTLPSTCPSSEICGILRNVNKTLKPGGALQLTLIDPVPRVATMGQNMRSWLETNLLPNLEKRFRCARPKQMFPQWLGEAGLRGPGSTLTTTKFYAMPESVRQGHERHPDPLLEETWVDRETKAEVRSLVGRSLWMLVWGPYVTADKWWWEEPACVEECLQLGTVWEHYLIRAIKDDLLPESSEEDFPLAMI